MARIVEQTTGSTFSFYPAKRNPAYHGSMLQIMGGSLNTDKFCIECKKDEAPLVVMLGIHSPTISPVFGMTFMQTSESNPLFCKEFFVCVRDSNTQWFASESKRVRDEFSNTFLRTKVISTSFYDTRISLSLTFEKDCKWDAIRLQPLFSAVLNLVCSHRGVDTYANIVPHLHKRLGEERDHVIPFLVTSELIDSIREGWYL